MALKKLPQKLKNLVNSTIFLLGEVIKEQAGDDFFGKVETIRTMMTKYRNQNNANRLKTLHKLHQIIDNLPKPQKIQLSQAFTLYLELVNSCEAAYRTWRLQGKKQQAPQKKHIRLTYVITAHPTESRSPGNILLFNKIQKMCILFFKQENHQIKEKIKHLLKLCWACAVTKHQRPTIEDEANHLFSIVLRKEILEQFLLADDLFGEVRLRTWVGGDKDGHPGVDEKILLDSLRLSRKKIYAIIDSYLLQIKEVLTILKNKKLSGQFLKTEQSFKYLKNVEKKDILRTENFSNQITAIDSMYENLIGGVNPEIKKIKKIIELFPGLVIPLELREDSSIVSDAASQTGPSYPIEKMLIKLGEIGGREKIRNYARGFVISMTRSAKDMFMAAQLVKKHLGKLYLPIIPLFETKDALDDSEKIIEELLCDETFKDALKKHWNKKMEVMLGYSDSSKGMGVLSSRLMIGKVVNSLDSLIEKAGYSPVFFHGSGGSIDRGGGPIAEQTAWWPPNALKHYKATIQGEMVERTFATAEIAMKHMQGIALNNALVKKQRTDPTKKLMEFTEEVRKHYVKKLEEPSFLDILLKATPYNFLDALRIGTRPNKRKSSHFKNIRAIPWVLCWTQTRVLFPTWWGIGSAWEKYKNDSTMCTSLKKEFKKNKLFSSFIRMLGFTLEKVDMNIWYMYLVLSDLDKKEIDFYYHSFLREYLLAKDFTRNICGQKNLLWERPWLLESIQLRAPMINPLNILQIIAFKSGNMELLRNTVTGVASGMMTTG